MWSNILVKTIMTPFSSIIHMFFAWFHCLHFRIIFVKLPAYFLIVILKKINNKQTWCTFTQKTKLTVKNCWFPIIIKWSHTENMNWRQHFQGKILNTASNVVGSSWNLCSKRDTTTAPPGTTFGTSFFKTLKCWFWDAKIYFWIVISL